MRRLLLTFLCFFILGKHHPLTAQVQARHAMVVSADSHATIAGVEVLRAGGNAIDAAVAVAFTLAVTYPEAGNIGGGGFMLIRRANGATNFIDFRERAPSNATRTMFLDSAGNVVPGKSEIGVVAAGVPGTVAGLLYALERYGTKSREQILKEAIRLAQQGFLVSDRQAASFDRHAVEFRRFPSTSRVFLKGGQPYRSGERFVQSDLASTLERIRVSGYDGFYGGVTANLIVDEVSRGGGMISPSDLTTYSVIEREPISARYRGLTIISGPPPAGGIVLLQLLGILGKFTLEDKMYQPATVAHLVASSAQLAYADRARYLGDPDYVNVPVESLISDSYLHERSRGIDTARATSSITVHPGELSGLEPHETTHFCAADSSGNVVSTTLTLNGSYGCMVVVDGAGFFLNNEMDDFVTKPGVPNQYGLVGAEANEIAPGKRMLSSMAPTILLKENRPFLLLGARGGSRITTAIAQVVMNVVDFGMSLGDAVEKPRVHHQWLPDELHYEPGALLQEDILILASMGHSLREVADPKGRIQALQIDSRTGIFYGVPDPREGGMAGGF